MQHLNRSIGSNHQLIGEKAIHQTTLTGVGPTVSGVGHSITANESIGSGDGNWSDARWVRTQRRFLRSIWRIALEGSQMDSFVTRTNTSDPSASPTTPPPSSHRFFPIHSRKWCFMCPLQCSNWSPFFFHFQTIYYFTVTFSFQVYFGSAKSSAGSLITFLNSSSFNLTLISPWMLPKVYFSATFFITLGHFIYFGSAKSSDGTLTTFLSSSSFNLTWISPWILPKVYLDMNIFNINLSCKPISP